MLKHITTISTALFFVLALSIILSPAAQAADTAPVLQPAEQELFARINAARAAAGLGQLTIMPQLEDISRSRSNDMAARNYFSHITPEGVTFIDMVNATMLDYTNIGEIIQRNNYADADSPAAAMNGYMNSALHKSFILTAEYSYVGVGVAKDASGMKYYTVIFLAK